MTDPKCLPSWRPARPSPSANGSRRPPSISAASLAALILLSAGGALAPVTDALAQPSPPDRELEGSAAPARAAPEQSPAAEPAQPADNGARREGGEAGGEATAIETEAAKTGAESTPSEPEPPTQAGGNERAADKAAPPQPTADSANEPEPQAAAPAKDTADGGTPTDGDPKARKPADKERAEDTAAPPAADQLLAVTTWSGAYGAAQREAVIEPFMAAHDVKLDVAMRSTETPLPLQGRSDKTTDVAEFSFAELEQGCKSGKLLRLPEPQAADDFLPGSVHACGKGAFAWSHVLAIAPDAFSGRRPETIADVFNAKLFPGKRAFAKNPQFLLEAALMAEGVSADEVYPLLSTPEGRKRAFNRLTLLRRNILWVDDSSAAVTALREGKAAIAQTFSGRAFFASVRGRPLDLIWDGQIYAMTYWGIVAASANRQLALKFVEFATETEQLAAVARRFPYGPARVSAVELVKGHRSAGLALAPYLPTTDSNLQSALRLDEVWWRENREAIDKEFESWLAKPVLAEGIALPPMPRPGR